MYSTLNIPKANLKIKDDLVWDRLRKKHVKLTPEEWVRQHFVYHLIDEAKKLQIKRLSIETGTGKFFSPARKLFDNCGFKPCEPFAHYKEDVNSFYLTKLLYNS